MWDPVVDTLVEHTDVELLDHNIEDADPMTVGEAFPLTAIDLIGTAGISSVNESACVFMLGGADAEAAANAIMALGENGAREVQVLVSPPQIALIGADAGTCMPLLLDALDTLGEEYEPPQTLMMSLPSSEMNKSYEYFAALMDNGASFDVSCSRSLDGALMDTKQDSDGDLTVGKKGVGLSSKGSYDYVIERCGSNGKAEIVMRRMLHTPDLPFAMVISEPTETYAHDYTFFMSKAKGRVMTTNKGEEFPLWMSKHKLGWMKVRAVSDPIKVMELQRTGSSARDQPALAVIGEGESRTVGMPTSKFGVLRGVELLRREHVLSGHLGLRQLLIQLKARGLPEGSLTKEHVEAYIKEGCGICESAKMRRRPFTLATNVIDKTAPSVGKVWIADEVILEIPSADHGFMCIYVAVDVASDWVFIRGMLRQTAEAVGQAEKQLQAFVRPVHGEIHIIRKDSLPAHRSVEHVKHQAEMGTHGQLSPPGVHEGVHKASGAP